MTPQTIPTSTSISSSSNSPSNSTKTSRTNHSLTPRLTVECLLNLLNDRTDFVPYTVDYSNFEASSLELLRLVFPEWLRNASNNNWKSHLKLAQCTDGITNKLMKCKNLTTGQVVLIRAYGKKSELIIDRQAELIVNPTLQGDGLAPPLHCRFENGFVYGYIPGIPLKPSQLSNPLLYPLIANKIARWHQVESVPGDRSPRLFRTLWKWFRNIPSRYTRTEVHEKFLKSDINIKFLEKELTDLEHSVKALNCPIVFCHNDLLSANIIYNPHDNDVSFIDYEYGSFNYRTFDLANHFCEFSGFACDYSLYPDEDFQRKWINEYLSHLGLALDNCDQIMKEVKVFTLTAHFFWGLWGLVQAQVSDISFDYMGYAALRFAEYKKRHQQQQQLQEQEQEQEFHDDV